MTLKLSQNKISGLKKTKKMKVGPQKVKKEPKIRSNSKVRIERNIENESCSTTWVHPNTLFEPFPNPKNSPLQPQKSKMTLELSQNQMSELKEEKKMKVVQLHN